MWTAGRQLGDKQIAVFSWSFFPPFHFYTEDSGGEREKVNRKVHRERNMCGGRRVKGNKLKWQIEIVCNSALFIKTSSAEKHSSPGRKEGNKSFYFTMFISCYQPNPSARCITTNQPRIVATANCALHGASVACRSKSGKKVKTFKILMWEQPSEHRACYTSLL